MQGKDCWHRSGNVFVLKTVMVMGLLAGLFLAGPVVQPLGAEEGKDPRMEHPMMQPGMQEGKVQQMEHGMMQSGMQESKAPPVEHPMMNPAKYTEKGMCPNCGMKLNMWARTRHQAQMKGAELETCSIHCLADLALREGTEPAEVKVALYLEPEKMLPAAQAVYVVGSSAPGTMTRVSKLAFADRAAADKFAAEYGGEVTDFAGAYQKAGEQMDHDRAGIDAKRKKSGKISEPTPADKCTVCGMPPAVYPNSRAQILTMDKHTLHFCSGQCLVNFLADPVKYAGPEVQPMSVWTTVYPEGMYDYAGGLYYVVGAKAMGPMGPEPFAFRTKKQAEEFMAKEGGSIAAFEELKPTPAGH